MTVPSTKPYFLRAIHEWCSDAGFTPHIAARVDEHVRIPPGYAQDGQIVLNLSEEAAVNLSLGNEVITFQARFGGVPHPVMVPVSHVMAIYARENGQGMGFEVDLSAEGEEPGKDDEAAPFVTPPSGATEAPDAPEETDGPDGPDNAPAGGSGRGSHLKVIK